MHQRLKLGILTYVHFCVDFICAFWVNYIILFDGTIGDQMIDFAYYVDTNGNMLLWAMIYNFCAFALQLPLGMLCDHLHQKKPWWMAASGCILIGIAGVIGFRSVYTSYYTSYSLAQMLSISILLGLGNAFFHVGAGVRVLQMGEKMTPLGVFISTGAFGVCLGSVFCNTLTSGNSYEKTSILFIMLTLLLSFASAIVLLLGSKMDSLGRSKQKNRQKAPARMTVRESRQINLSGMSIRKNGQMAFVNAVSIVLLFLVVVLRSFQGSFVQFSWKTGIPITLLFALCIVAGKALGGVIADRFGVPVALIPLLLSALLFLRSEDMLPGLAAILLFQTTMPITLSLMHKQLPALPGTAFGLLSFALFVGYLPKFLHVYSGINVSDYTSGYRVVIGKWSFYQFSYNVTKWWWKLKWQGGVYAYSIVTVLSFILFVFLLSLHYRFKKER